MTTPTQPKLTIETPFGVAEITDARYYADHQDHRPTLARIHFENGLTVNRKLYDRGVSFEIQRPTYRMGEVPYHVMSAGYNYRELTDKAREKVTSWFEHEDRHEIFAPYLEPLDADDLRRQMRSSVRHTVANAMYDAEGDRKYPEGSRKLIHELIREVLQEALDATKDGGTFSNFYFERDK